MANREAPNNLLDLFEQYALVAGALVTRVATVADAAALIATGPIKCTSAVRERYPELLQALSQAGQPVTVAEDLATAEQAPSALAVALAGGSGIVLARAGVAETGSVALADNALAPRLLSMLADSCFVLLPASAILPNLDAAGELLEKLVAAGRRYVSLVTGPSRTADIERVLTIGVQGPKVLHIIILTEKGA